SLWPRKTILPGPRWAFSCLSRRSKHSSQHIDSPPMKDHRVAEVRPNRPSALQADLLFHFCRMQLPTVSFNRNQFDHHLERAFDLFMAKVGKRVAWETWLENLCPLDWYLASACL